MGKRGFTLVEVMIAVAVMGIGMLGLLRLQVISIITTDHSRLLSRATTLAESKLAETLAAGCPQPGTTRGRTDDRTPLDWQVMVADDQPDATPEGEGEHKVRPYGCRRVTVVVQWNEGRSRRDVRLVTLAFDGRGQ